MILFTGAPQAWNKLISSLPQAHLLQTAEWSQVKEKYGWQPMPFIWREASRKPIAAAMVLKRSLPIRGLAKRLCIMYVPKGPIMDWNETSIRRHVLGDLKSLAKSQEAIFIKVDPDVALGKGVPGSASAVEFSNGQEVMADLLKTDWFFSQDQIQFRNTVVVDLSPDEEKLLARMKQKTRYNIRLAQKKGVTVRIGGEDDLPLLYRMYAETSVRDDFLIREEGYYQTVWQTFMNNAPSASGSQPFCEPLIAEVDGEAVGAVTVFHFSGQAIYLFGMSREEQREKMPNHLLQWEAMRRARELGCSTYNLWGAPNEFDESDALWGVFRFKEGFGGEVVRTIGAWDFTPSPIIYKLYAEILPRVMGFMRARGKGKTRRIVNQ